MFEGDGVVYYLDCGDVSGVNTYVQTYQVVHFKHVQCIVRRLYIHKAVNNF